MGHERVGKLPKSKQWRAIVGQIAASSNADFDVASVAQQTISQVRHRFRNLRDDDGTRAAFTFLVQLAVSSRKVDALDEFATAVNAKADTFTPLKAAKALRIATANSSGAQEYIVIVQAAATDAMVRWYETNKPKQQHLFDSFGTSYDVWHKAGNGAGFCELARLFFSSTVERYLNYFLEREASQVLPTLADRTLFQENIDAHLDYISRHAFETSKITQSYAAGWFNLYAGDHIPPDEEIDRFISYAFGKLQDELMREGTLQ